MGGNARRMGANTGSVNLYNHICAEAMGLRDDDGGNQDITTRNKSTTMYSLIKEPRIFTRLSIRDSRDAYQA